MILSDFGLTLKIEEMRFKQFDTAALLVSTLLLNRLLYIYIFHSFLLRSDEVTKVCPQKIFKHICTIFKNKNKHIC